MGPLYNTKAQSGITRKQMTRNYKIMFQINNSELFYNFPGEAINLKNGYSMFSRSFKIAFVHFTRLYTFNTLEKPVLEQRNRRVLVAIDEYTAGFIRTINSDEYFQK